MKLVIMNDTQIFLHPDTFDSRSENIRYFIWVCIILCFSHVKWSFTLPKDTKYQLNANMSACDKASGHRYSVLRIRYIGQLSHGDWSGLKHSSGRTFSCAMDCFKGCILQKQWHTLGPKVLSIICDMELAKNAIFKLISLFHMTIYSNIQCCSYNRKKPRDIENSRRKSYQNRIPI